MKIRYKFGRKRLPYSTTKKTAFIFSIVILSLFSSTAITAQPNSSPNDDYHVQHFGLAEGLQSTIYSILSDNNGFLWVTTPVGIFRFDGTNFLQFPIKETIYNGNFNNVLILHYKDKNEDTIITSYAFHTKGFTISSNKLNNIKPKAGFIYFENQKYPVFAPAFIYEKMSVVELAKRDNWLTSTVDYTYTGGRCNKDVIWVATKYGIIFYNNNGIVNKINIPEVEKAKMISTGNDILFLDKDNYLNRYTLEGLQNRELINIPCKKGLSIYSNRLEKGFYCIADRCLYKGTISKTGKPNFYKLITNLVNTTEVSTIVEKDSNTVLIGTLTDGLYIYKRNIFKVSEPLPNNQPNSFFIQQLLPDSATIFAGKGYLFNNGRYYSKQLAGFDKAFFGIIKDNKNRYWYGIDEYILRTRKLGVVADTVKHIDGKFAEIMPEDNAGRIWVATNLQFGYFKDDKYTDVKIEKFAGQRINCMQQREDGKYYIGADLGLFVLDNADQRNVKEIAAFKSMQVRDIIPRADGSVWICTNGEGLFLIDKDKVTTFLPINKKLDFVHTIIEDDRGYCWLPTNNGLFVTLKKSLMEFVKDKGKLPFFYKFSTVDGLRVNEFNGGVYPSYLRLPGGGISLTSMDGIVCFNPSKAYFSFSDSPISIDRILLDSDKIEEKDTFSISNTVKNIHFSVATASWGNKENDVFEYSVTEKGDSINEGQWLEISETGKIDLFSLKHGDYKLTIRKRIGFGTNDYVYKTNNFHVLPKWYQTKAFEFARVCCIIAALIGIFFWRRRYYRKANLKLEEKVNAATFKLQQLNATLEKKVAERTAAILEAEKKFRTLVEKSLVGVSIVQDNKYVYVNPIFEKIFGYESGELIGSDVFSIVSERQRDIVIKKAVPHLLGEINTQHYEFEGVKKDGTFCMLEFLGTYIIYEGKPAIIGTMLDVTEKKKMEQEKLDRKDEEKKITVRGILLGEERERNKIGQELHDNINQILAGTRLYLNTAKNHSNGEEKNIIIESIKLVDSAIEEIRSFSKNKVTPTKRRELEEMLQSLLKQMTYDINTTLLYKVNGVLIEDDLKLNIYRIVQEQLNNIIKHAKAKNVLITMEANDANLFITISDDGKGFDTNAKKNGIGISNMINRVESFDGTIAIKSSPGNGCTIAITLPYDNLQMA